MTCMRCGRLEAALKAAINRLYNQGGDISQITHEINMDVAKAGEAVLEDGKKDILAQFDDLAARVRDTLSR